MGFSFAFGKIDKNWTETGRQEVD